MGQALFNKWVVRGGRRISELESDLASPLNNAIGMSGIDPKAGNLDVGVLLPMDQFEGWMAAYPAARAAFDQAPKEAKPKLVEWPDLKVWGSDNIMPASFALAKDQAVVATTDGKKVHKVSGYNRADGARQWTADLPEQPAMNRMALDRDGHVLVSLCDGSVICLGK